MIVGFGLFVMYRPIPPNSIMKLDASYLHLLYFFLKRCGFRDQMTGLSIFKLANIMIQLSGKGRGYLPNVWNGFTYFILENKPIITSTKLQNNYPGMVRDS